MSPQGRRPEPERPRLRASALGGANAHRRLLLVRHEYLYKA
jgi:hypothetical protein